MAEENPEFKPFELAALVYSMELLEMVRGLLAWQAHMGGFEAPVWGKAQALIDRIEKFEFSKKE